MDLESVATDRALWLQRRDSHSSQSAIYPPTLRSSSIGSLFPPEMNPMNRVPAAFLPRIPCYPSYNFASPSSTSMCSPSALSSPYGSLSPSRAESTLSSVSRSTSSTSSRKSPLSTMRRASEPDVPIIPAKFLEVTNKPQLQRSPTLPCSWSPTLTHAPLSADPAIRAFSTECESDFDQPVNNRTSAQKSSSNSICIDQSSAEISPGNQFPAVRPELPVRARGHSVPCDVTTSTRPPLESPQRAATYFTYPRVSKAPASRTLSSLDIPRTRPALTCDSNHPQGIRRPQLTQCPSLAHSNRKISSTLSTEFTTRNMLEAQRVKKRWELARSREANVYGMGTWSTVPEESRKRTSNMRKARDGVIRKQRACTAS